MTAWNRKGHVQFIKTLCSWEFEGVCFIESEQQNSGQHKPQVEMTSGDILVPPTWGIILSPPRTKDLATGTLFQCKEGELGPRENIQEEKKVNRAQEHKELERFWSPCSSSTNTQNLPYLEFITGRAAKSSCWIHPPQVEFIRNNYKTPSILLLARMVRKDERKWLELQQERSRLDIRKHFLLKRVVSIGCSGQWQSHHPWKSSKGVWWHLGTWWSWRLFLL